jgi:hypothetical protein
VSARTAIPIVGRGNGRDTADKAFYKGGGSIDGPGGLFFRDGVFTYDRARDMVAKTNGVKLSDPN